MIREVCETKLPGVLLIKLDIFEDHRGSYTELYNEEEFRKKVGKFSPVFVQDDISISKKNVLRGIHGDAVTWKLISCLSGAFYLVVVDCDEKSKNFGQWQSFMMTADLGLQVLIPPRYGNGHLVLTNSAVFHYKQSEYYNRANQFTYRYDDPRFGIYWPVRNPILSQRDQG